MQTQPQNDRLPEWMRKKNLDSAAVLAVKRMLRDRRLHTVCQSAGCPNISECFGSGRAAFLILGSICTRHCGFCGVEKGAPVPPDPEEPERVALMVRALGLRHAVVTSVTRDDLQDGGAGQFAETVRRIRLSSPDSTVETLVPDFQGNPDSLRTVMESGVNVLNHNVETVPRLYPMVRPGADFERSLGVFRLAGREYPGRLTKSGLMVGLGETRDELIEAFKRLVDSGCEALTVGQYIAPSRSSIPVREYVAPEDFDAIRNAALETGFRRVKAGPFVRSSYRADELMSP